MCKIDLDKFQYKSFKNSEITWLVYSTMYSYLITEILCMILNNISNRERVDLRYDSYYFKDYKIIIRNLYYTPYNNKILGICYYNSHA
jgi:hypothetical protein